MNVGEAVGITVGVLAILAALWRTVRAVYRLIRIGETALDRLSSVEKELRPNGGTSLRDRVDQVHDIAVDNNDKHARIERRLDDQARLTADAARVAAKNDDEIENMRAETNRRHAQNLERFEDLQRKDEDGQILREWALTVLRDKHGIDLLPDEDSDDA